MRHLIHFQGAVYHAMLRGNRKHAIFHDDDDYVRFGKMFCKSLDKHDVLCHAYCWMPNHVHMLVQVRNVSLDKFIHLFATRYAQSYNQKYGLTGHLFQGRYRKELVGDDSYLLQVTRYIHYNPVKSRLAPKPSEYRWSSFDSYVHPHGSFVTTGLVLPTFGKSPAARTAFLEFHDVEDTHVPGWERELPADKFETRSAPEPSGTTIDELIVSTLERFGICYEELCGRSRNHHVAAARGWLVNEVRRSGCATLSEIARRLGRTPQSCSRLADRHQ